MFFSLGIVLYELLFGHRPFETAGTEYRRLANEWVENADVLEFSDFQRNADDQGAVGLFEIAKSIFLGRTCAASQTRSAIQQIIRDYSEVKFPWNLDHRVGWGYRTDRPIKLERWMRFNHSRPNVVLTDVTFEESAFDTVRGILDCWGLELASAPRPLRTIQRIEEETGTINLRVVATDSRNSEHTLLVRVHRNSCSPDDLQQLLDLHCHVANEGVFPDATDYILPISTKSGSRFATFRDSHVTLFKYAAASHCTCREVDELLDYAMKLGQLNQSLARYEGDLPQPINWARQWDAQETEELELLLRCVETAAGNGDKLSGSLSENRQVIEGALSDVSDFAFQPSDLALVHDCHPHNTFFEGNRCVLIYDYESVARGYCHESVVAFSLHRFVREFARQKRNRLDLTALGGISRDFVRNYEHGFGSSLGDDFVQSLDQHVSLVNLRKMKNNLAYLHGLRPDPGNRSVDVWRSEVHKFLVCLAEAKVLSSSIAE